MKEEQYIYGVIYEFKWTGIELIFLSLDFKRTEEFYNNIYESKVYRINLVKLSLNEKLWYRNWEIIKTKTREE